MRDKKGCTCWLTKERVREGNEFLLKLNEGEEKKSQVRVKKKKRRRIRVARKSREEASQRSTKPIAKKRQSQAGGGYFLSCTIQMWTSATCPSLNWICIQSLIVQSERGASLSCCLCFSCL